jgi:hypothetical protein
MPPDERIRTPLSLGPKSMTSGQTVGVSIDAFDEIVKRDEIHLYVGLG